LPPKCLPATGNFRGIGNWRGKDLALVIGRKYDMSLRRHNEYNELKVFLGKVVEVNQEFKKKKILCVCLG